jgi:hypothetical protein
MSGEERHKKVRGNQEGKKGKGSGAPNPLLAVMAHVPKASAKENTKGASHTHAVDMKGVSHTQVLSMKGASHTQASEGKKTANSPLLSLSESKEGASNTPAPNLTKVSKEDGVLLSVGEEQNLEGEKNDKAQKAKEQMAATLKYLARELSDIGGPLLSDTIDAYHLACYQALDAERGYLSDKMRKEHCAFNVVEIWQQGVEMVRQSGGANRIYTALVNEEWQYQQYRELFRELFRKRTERWERTIDAPVAPLMGTCPEAVKRWLTGAAQRLQAAKNLEAKEQGKSASASLKEETGELARKSAIPEDVWKQWQE